MAQLTARKDRFENEVDNLFFVRGTLSVEMKKPRPELTCPKVKNEPLMGQATSHKPSAENLEQRAKAAQYELDGPPVRVILQLSRENCRQEQAGRIVRRD